MVRFPYSTKTTILQTRELRRRANLVSLENLAGPCPPLASCRVAERSAHPVAWAGAWRHLAAVPQARQDEQDL